VQPTLIGEHRDIGDRLTTISDHHRQIGQHDPADARRRAADPAQDRDLLVQPHRQPVRSASPPNNAVPCDP
jgi:hypothetical protein